MFKKILILWIVFILVLSILTGCSQVQNIKMDEKVVISQAAEKQTNSVKNSLEPNFDEMYKNTTEIAVKYDSNDFLYRNKSIEIKDGKMISDILSMIGKSQLISDETKINNMSGMAAKDNSLILTSGDGSKTEIKFAFDDPAFEVGYLEIGEKKYDPGFSFFRYIRDLSQYRQFDTNIDNSVLELFKKYNWTVDYKVNTIDLTLPINLKHDAGEYPVKIYWAYNNELSRNIGLDYSSYLGKNVEVDIYRLREPLPDNMKPRMDSRGIVLKYGKEIVGAFIDAGRHNNFACSLDRKSLKDITGKEWDSWVSDYINYDNELEIKLSKMSPEEIIKQYYAAVNNHDEKLQFACKTRQNICDYLAMNMDNNLLINGGFTDAFPGDEDNIKSARFINLREAGVTGNPEGTLEYAVTVDFKFKKEITSESGKQTRFVILKKESEKSGWRIQSEGTGP